MFILLLKAFVGLVAAATAIRWAQALTLGVVRCGPVRAGIIAHRSREPFSYWFLMAVNAASVAFFLWLIFR